MKPTVLAFCVISALFVSTNIAYSRPIPSEESLKATFDKMLYVIRDKCTKEYPVNDKKFQKCVSSTHSAMNWFFTTLFSYRDTKGINSEGFKKGIDCAEKYSPAVSEPGRKVSLEQANWLYVKNCYQEALSK